MSELANPIELTPKAVAHLKKYLQSKPTATGVCFGVEETGCSGFSYTVSYLEETSHEPTLVVEDIPIYIEPNHISYLEGMSVDFQKQGLNEKFVFNNPKEKGVCGCGESFHF